MLRHLFDMGLCGCDCSDSGSKKLEDWVWLSIGKKRSTMLSAMPMARSGLRYRFSIVMLATFVRLNVTHIREPSSYTEGYHRYRPSTPNYSARSS